MPKPNQTYQLAQWFVTQILKRNFDVRFDKLHLKAAKELVNPAGAEKLDPEVVRLCVEYMAEGGFGWDKPITSLYCVTWGEPAYYRRMLEKIGQVPPVYMIGEYDTWFVKYGSTAKRLGLWDGLYQGYENPAETPYRLPAQDVAGILLAMAV